MEKILEEVLDDILNDNEQDIENNIRLNQNNENNEIEVEMETKEYKFKPGVGLDIGTSNIVVSRQTEDGKFVNKFHRNMLYELDISDEAQDLLDRSDYLYVKSNDKFYIVGEDALKLVNAIGKGEVIRPMQNGLLNPSLKEATELLFYIIQAVVGEPIAENESLRFSVPANPVDKDIDNLFHKMVLGGFLKKVGYDAKPLNEAMSVAYFCNPVSKSEEGDLPLTGLAFSMGAGMTNVALTLKGMELGSFSITLSGDYIDNSASKVTGVMPSKVLRKKEKELDLLNVEHSDRVLSALSIYYEEVIDRLIKLSAKQFSKMGSDVEGEVEIVIAGGTSMAKNYCGKFEEILKNYKFPFKILGVRHSNDPFMSVSNGCCIRAMADQAKKAQ
jgi:hypothetical protein